MDKKDKMDKMDKKYMDKSRQIDRDKMDSKENKVNYPLKCKK